MKKHYDIVSFDLDGTLVDSASEIAEAANRALQAHGLGARPTEEITALIGAGTRELMLKLLARIFLEQPAHADRVEVDRVLADFDVHYAQTTGTTAKPYAGAAAALRALREAGVRLACVTNKEQRHAQRLLDHLRLSGCFDLVLGGDTLPHKKPHASVLRHVVDALGGDARRSAHVGDSAIDVQAARNAGLAAWAVPWGYNAGRPIEDSKPERIFPSLPALADHVLGAAS